MPSKNQIELLLGVPMCVGPDRGPRGQNRKVDVVTSAAEPMGRPRLARRMTRCNPAKTDRTASAVSNDLGQRKLIQIGSSQRWADGHAASSFRLERFLQFYRWSRFGLCN